jgi:hypothetical protein
VQQCAAPLSSNNSSRPSDNNSAAAAASAAPLCAGWDCCPLVLVPWGAADVAQMHRFIMTLRCNIQGGMVSNLVKKQHLC